MYYNKSRIKKTGTPIIGIIFTNLEETNSFTENLNLKTVLNKRSIQMFGNKSVKICFIKSEKNLIEKGVKYLFSKYPDIDVISYIGYCYSNKHKSGDIFLIDKITNQETSRDYYPDILKPQFNLASLITIPKLYTKLDYNNLYDTESSSFFEISSNYLSADRINIIKIIKDSNDINISDSKMMKRNIFKKILNYLQSFQKKKSYTYFYNNELLQIDNFVSQYHFTVTQKRQFLKLLWINKVQTGKSLLKILELLKIKFDEKQNKKILSKKIINHCSSLIEN